jgi:metallothionein
MATVKCACDRCKCEISLEQAIKKDDNYYCCQACADGHVSDPSCHNSECHCGS